MSKMIKHKTLMIYLLLRPPSSLVTFQRRSRSDERPVWCTKQRKHFDPSKQCQQLKLTLQTQFSTWDSVNSISRLLDTSSILQWPPWPLCIKDVFNQFATELVPSHPRIIIKPFQLPSFITMVDQQCTQPFTIHSVKWLAEPRKEKLER